MKMIMEIVSSIFLLFFIREKMISINPFWEREVENATITDFRIFSGSEYYKAFYYFAFSVVTTTSGKQYLILRRKDDYINKQITILHDGKTAVRKDGIMHFTSPCEKLYLMLAVFMMLFSASCFTAGMNCVIFYICFIIVAFVLMPFFNLKFMAYFEKRFDDENSNRADLEIALEQLLGPDLKNIPTSVAVKIFVVILGAFLMLLYRLSISN